MKISILEMFESNGGRLVHFRCEYGEAKAGWGGVAPASIGQYDVELDCDETLIENSNFVTTSSQNPRIWIDGPMIHLTAIVDGVYEDTSTATLRLGDSLMLIGYEGTFPSVSTWIELKIKDLRVNDINT